MASEGQLGHYLQYEYVAVRQKSEILRWRVHKHEESAQVGGRVSWSEVSRKGLAKWQIT